MNRRNVYYKKIFIGIFLVIICATLNSCIIRSLYPFCYNNDSIKNNGLTGIWYEKDSDDSIYIGDLESDTRFYVLKFRNIILSHTIDDSPISPITEHNCDTGILKGILFNIEDNTFLDITASEIDLEKQIKPIAALYLTNVHSLVKVDIQKNKLIFYELNYDKMREYYSNNKIKNLKCFAGNAENDGSILLVSETKDLKKFLKKHKDDKDLFLQCTEYLKR